MTPFDPDDLSVDSLTSQANAWIVRITSGHASVEDGEALRAWCAQSPAHARAYRRAAALWRVLGMLPNTARASRRSLFGHAAMLSSGTAAACLLFSTLWFTWTGYMPDARALLADLSTTTAEQRLTILDDGSQVTLDARSRLNLAFNQSRRAINLAAGAAIFQVAHDPDKPFVVQAGDIQVTAIGTVFEVRHQGDAVRVTCTEGVVAVNAPGQAEQRLQAGEQLTLGAVKAAQVQPVDGVGELAWQRGQLKFRQRPLAELLEELNRYRPGKIILAAAGKADRPVSGVFHLSRPDQALEHIIQSQRLQATYYPGGVVLLR